MLTLARKIVLLGGIEQNKIQFQTVCTVGDTFDPSITLRTGCPYTPQWNLGDGTITTGTSVSYAGYANAGPHTVTLTIPNIAYWLIGIDVNTDKITGDFLGAIRKCVSLTNIQAGENYALIGKLSNLVGMTKLATLTLGDHTAVTGDIAVLAGLPLTFLRLSGSAVHGDVASIAGLIALTFLDIHSNVSNGGLTGDLNAFAGMHSLYFLSFGNTFITGDIGDLAGLTGLQTFLFYTGSPATNVIVGQLSDTAGMTNLIYLSGEGEDSGGFVATGGISANHKIRDLHVEDCAWNQAMVDALLLDIYTNRASFTSIVTPILLTIQANNETPSGIYQDDATPSTGLEYVYKLANDPDAEGFKKWKITWNGGIAP